MCYADTTSKLEQVFEGLFQSTVMKNNGILLIFDFFRKAKASSSPGEAKTYGFDDLPVASKLAGISLHALYQKLERTI